MLRVRASISLGELSERSAKKPIERAEKICKYCFKLWKPLSGMAGKVREHCYSEDCMSAHDARRNEQRRARYAVMRVPQR